MKKNLFTMSLLALVLSLLLPARVMAVQAEVDGIWYVFDESAKTAAVFRSQGTAYTGSVMISSTVTYGSIPYTVTSIGAYAFSDCFGLTSITIPEGVTSIGNYAFWGCTSLTSISIPVGVASIGDYAFSHCDGLTSIVVESCNSVFDSRENCNAIIKTSTNELIAGCKTTTIPSSVTSIGNFAFLRCSGLTSITIPEGVTSIGDRAFSGCSSLTSITIPGSVTSIGYEAFSDTPFYDNQPDGLLYLGKVAYKYKGTMSANTAISLREGTVGIAGSAFQNCSGLTSITIPGGVTSIGDYAFSSCSGLTSITIPGGVTSIGDYAFSSCSGLTSVTIPEGVTSIGNGAFEGCDGLTSITIPESVTSIGRGAFSNTPFYNNQPNGLVYLGKVAYKYKGTMPANTSISLKVGTASIAGSAFSGCSGLTSITIPSSVTSIEGSAFSGCSSLTSITIPEGVTSIENSAFSSCTGLASIAVESGNSVYDSRENSNAIIKTSTNELIAGCKNTAIPNSVTSIGGSAFSGCSGLTSITIPSSVTSIGREAFRFCNSLTSIIIPDGVTSIGISAFSGCSGLTSITIPESVTSIGYTAFLGCAGLTSITIPEGVTGIGIDAFNGCSNLTSVTVKNPTPVTICSGVFSNRENATLYVPAGSKAAYEAASYWKDFREIVEMAPDEPAYPEIEDFAVVLDGERQTLHGKLVAKDGEEYIVTDSGVYRVTGRSRERLAGDVNADGKITIADVTALVNVILGHAEAESATIYDVERVKE